MRIARIDSGDQSGYWSYLGTDILSIAAGEPTMNLQEFSMDTPESEFHRVVRHETGHALYEQGRPQAWLAQPAGRARGTTSLMSWLAA